MLWFLSGCLFDYYADYFHYQAVEYVVDSPRVVAISGNPTSLISEETIELDALLLAAKGSDIGEWTVSTCGLGRNVRTTIFDLSCFEDESEVTELGFGSMPMSLTVPSFPHIEDCDEPIPTEDTGNEVANEENEEDSEDGEEETNWRKSDGCAHTLPLLLKTTVDGVPVYAASFPPWRTVTSEWYQPAFGPPPTGFEVPDTASPGEELLVTFQIHDDLRMGGTFHWYIDKGELKDTGLTTTQAFIGPGTSHPNGVSTTTNRWVLPEDASGTLRIWVVVQIQGTAMEMVWRSAQVEVQ